MLYQTPLYKFVLSNYWTKSRPVLLRSEIEDQFGAEDVQQLVENAILKKVDEGEYSLCTDVVGTTGWLVYDFLFNHEDVSSFEELKRRFGTEILAEYPLRKYWQLWTDLNQVGEEIFAGQEAESQLV